MHQIPNLTELRAGKPGYESRYPIESQNTLYHDPLVDLRDFGFPDATSYYSKPNTLTGVVLPGVPDAPLARLDIARRLNDAEQYLRHDGEVREALGSPAHLRVDDALRPYEVQKFAFEVAWPAILKSQNPELSDAEIAAQVPNYCARPSIVPTPHSTGGAVDVALINLENGEAFNRGHKSGAIKGTAYPDFYESYQKDEGQSDIVGLVEEAEASPEVRRQIMISRRVLYTAMTKAGLLVNPQEIWHYGKGDPLSEYVSGSHSPYYGLPELPQWYIDEIKALPSTSTD